MVQCIAWNAFGGKKILSHFYLVATQHGVGAFRIINRNKRFVVYSDLDREPIKDWMRDNGKAVTTGYRFKRLDLTASQNNCRLRRFEGTDFPNDFPFLLDVEKTANSNAFTTSIRYLEHGPSGQPLDELLETAQSINKDEKQLYLAKKAVAMAEVDQLWGLF